MAFKQVGQKFDKIKAFDMAIGAEYEGYFVGYQEYVDRENDQTSYNFLFQQEEGGEKTLMQVCGNLTYCHQDGKLTVGQRTKITRIKDIPKSKGKGLKSNFSIEQDDENVIDVDAPSTFSASTATNDLDRAIGGTEPVASPRVQATLNRAQQRQEGLNAKAKRLQEG